MKKNRVPAILLVAGIVIGVLSVGLLSAWTISGFGASAAKTKKEWAAWQANGLPTTRNEVVTAPPISDADDAAVPLREAIRLIQKKGQPPPEIVAEHSWKSGSRARYLAANQDVLELFMQASERKGFQIDVNWDRPIEFRFGNENNLVERTTWLHDDAVLRVEKDWRGAVRRLGAARRLSGFQARLPDDRAFSRALYRDEQTFFAAGQCAAALADDPAALAALRATLEASSWQADFVPMLRAKAYNDLALHRSLTDFQVFEGARGNADLMIPVRRSSGEGLPASVMSKAVLAEAMAFWNEFYPRLAQPKPDLDRAALDIGVWFTNMTTSPSVSVQLAANTISAPSTYGSLIKRRLAGERVTLAYIRVLEHRARVGTWPASLKVAGAADTDPISGKPLMYDATGGRVRIWSVGVDGRDSGGATPWEVAANPVLVVGDDIAAVYPWPARP